MRAVLDPGRLGAPVAFSNEQLATVAGVLAVLFVVIVLNNVAAMRARSRARSAAAGGGAPDPGSGPVHPLLVKFARHEGSIVGETVALDGDLLVLKQAGVFKAVPARQAEARGDDVVLTGAIDWAAAEAAGREWHEARRRADAGVSGALTRSEDVKAPALDAVRSREGRT
jgi:hypothetical protein